MERYGFFGGSFNPPTKAHVYLAQEIKRKFELDKLFFVPVGNYYKKDQLIDEKHRYEMLQIACQNTELEVSNIELNRSKSLSAFDAFHLIKNTYPNQKLYYIMGVDNLLQLPTWRNAKDLIASFQFIIIERQAYQLEKVIRENELLDQYRQNFLKMENEKHCYDSSTKIREMLKKEKKENIIELLDEKVYYYIRKNHLYGQKS